ncbi:hypothetical protein Hanom_Chr07g00625941 [Helianthus anomalus]
MNFCRSKNKQSSPCRLQRFGPALLLQMFADVVRRLETFYLRKNKQHLSLIMVRQDSLLLLNQGHQ